MLTPDPKFTPNTPGSEKSDLGDSHSGEKSTRSDASRTRRLLDRQADALEQLVFVLDPSKKPKKRGVARFVGYMMLASSIVLGGYEFVSWVFEQWERRAMIANWLAVARDMQDVENAPELALELLEQANEVDPQSADVVRLRAYVRGMQAVKRLLQLDRPMSTEDVAIAAAAAAEASLLEQLDPNAPDWALLRGQLAMAQREPERARAYFETALSLDPENVLVRVRSADMHFEHGKSIETTDPVAAKEEFATAKRFLDEALVIDSQSKLAWLYRGLHALRDDPTEALRAFDQAIAIDARFELAVRNRAIALINLERFTDAESALHRALEIQPDSVGALGNLSYLYGINDDYESALLYARRATEVGPDSLNAWIWRAALEFDMSTLAEGAGRSSDADALRTAARVSYDKAIELHPRSAEVRKERSQFFRKSKELQLAGADARQATMLAPSDPFAWFVLAEYQLEIGEFDAAKTSLEKVLSLDPKFDTAHAMLAQLSEREGNFAAALVSLGKAIEVAEPDFQARFRRDRALFHERRGDLPLALADAIAARSAQSEEFELWFLEASLLVKLGRLEEACAALVEANQRRPDTAEVVELRAKANCGGH